MARTYVVLVLPLQRITAATGDYRVGLMPLRELPRGQAVIAYFATYFAVFTVLAFTLIHKGDFRPHAPDGPALT